MFNGLERLALFSLSAAIGLVDLAIALFVAAYMGVIPKDKVQNFMRRAAEVPVVGALLDRKVEVPVAKRAAAAKPKANKKR
ncbi:MAG: hypothetical protein SF051_05605 [Elusimicrobiota bacterium]|nr:hypothetical protein [Elusimicrobiota bacterium]